MESESGSFPALDTLCAGVVESRCMSLIKSMSKRDGWSEKWRTTLGVEMKLGSFGMAQCRGHIPSNHKCQSRAG